MFRRKIKQRDSEFVTARRRRILAAFGFSKMQITVTLLSLLGLLLFYMLFISGVFQLHIIRFMPEQLGCTSVDKIKGEIPKGKNLLLIDTDHLEALIKVKFPCLEQVHAVKQFPDTILISASERQTAAFLKVGTRVEELSSSPLPLDFVTPEASISSQSATPKVEIDPFKIDETSYPMTFSIDKEGFVIQENSVIEGGLPVFYYLTDKHIGVNTNLDSEIIENSLAVVDQLKNRAILFNEAKIEGDSLYINGPEKYIFLLRKGIKEQVISLQLIQQKAKIDSTEVEKIDLRFDKPVVIYSKKK